MLKFILDIPHILLQVVKKYPVESGATATVTTAASALSTTLVILQIISMCIGIPVGIITLYVFFERKGLLPKWMLLMDKSARHLKEKNKK